MSTVPNSDSPPRRRKARDGSGSIRRLSSGRWQARLPLNLGHLSIGTYDSHREAQDALTDAIGRERRAGSRRPTRDQRQGRVITVAAVVEAFIDARAAGAVGIDPNTASDYRSLHKTRIAETPLGRQRVDRVRPSDIAAWDEDLVSSGKAATSRNALRLLKGALRWATTRADIPLDISPATDYRRPQTTKAAVAASTSHKRQTLPIASLASLAQLLPERSDRLFLLTLAWTGARFAEVAGLPRTGSLAPGQSLVTLSGVPERRDGEWVVSPPKNGFARDLYVPDPLADRLRDHAAALKAPDDPALWDALLPDRTLSGRRRDGGGVWTPSSWRRVAWTSALNAAALRDVQARDLRPTAVSLLYLAGADAQDCSRYLGHRSLTTTMEYYIRASETDWPEEVEALRRDTSLRLPARLTRLWEWWVSEYGDPLTDSA